ncbi:MAG TPA: alpha/beta hydrolase [Alphaproteobacteria bacterium]|nr:alpha/beta hydrolase [Alphaproteobacteria bacterium]
MSAPAPPVRARFGLEYAHHDEACLGDLYAPGEATTAPVVVAVHGGGWKSGSAQFYRHWGPYLAAHGIALFAIDYRLADGRGNRHPAAAQDVRAALAFVRANAAALGIDPTRIGLIGDSAGAHLAALVALAGETIPLAEGGDAAIPVKAVVGVYGVYDLLAQWQHDLAARPRDQITELLMGTSPIEDRLAFFAASPLAYATRRESPPAFLIAWGTADDIVDWQTQSRVFVAALKQAGFFVRTAPLAEAPHFWMSDPLDEPHGYPARFAPVLLRFLRERL